MKFWKILLLCMILLTSLYAASAISSGQAEILSACKKECKSQFKLNLSLCQDSFNECKSISKNITETRLCMKNKTKCIRDLGTYNHDCLEECSSILKPKGCLDNTIKIGEVFTEGCNICECKINGKISCKKEEFCNMNVSVEENSCVQAGGLYQQLCNGPYFDIVCSAQNFCICGGNFNYTCPQNNICLKDFISPNKRLTTITGWKTLSGVALGDIGVCAY